MEIKTRKQAISDGSKFYFTGRPCKKGHISKRHIGSGCYQCTLEFQKVYRATHSQKWKDKNKRWNDANREEKKAIDKIYRDTHREQRKAQRLSYKIAKRRATPSVANEWDTFVALECKALIKTRYDQTNIEWHIDHMYPLNAKEVCGLHCGDNLQVIPAIMNSEKGNSLCLVERYEFLK